MGIKVVLYNSNLCMENGNSKLFLYYCPLHQTEANDITGKGKVSSIPNRNILDPQLPRYRLTEEQILNIGSPWIPVTCSMNLNGVTWDSRIMGKFNAEHRDVIGEPGVYHLRYQRWQLYTFLNDDQLIDRSISGYWQRVPKDLNDILTDIDPPALPPPPALGP